jgi:hypothetical protein
MQGRLATDRQAGRAVFPAQCTQLGVADLVTLASCTTVPRKAVVAQCTRVCHGGIQLTGVQQV